MSTNSQNSAHGSVYNDWHNHRHHKWVHWLVFIVLALLSGLFLSKQIDNWEKQSTDSGVVVTIAKPSATISLDPQTATVKVDETFAVNIVLDTGTNPVEAVDIYSLHYDPTILDVVDDVSNKSGTQIQAGSIIATNSFNDVNEATGTIKFAQSVTGSSFTGKGVLATIHFKAKAPGSSFLKFDFVKGSTVDTNAAYKRKDQLTTVVDAVYTVQPK
jgi:hypothetical protein